MKTGDNIFTPIDLSVEEAQAKETELRNLIAKRLPNLKKIESREEYKNVRLKFLQDKDKQAYYKLENAALKYALNDMVNVFLNFQVLSYDFEDAISDVYRQTHEKMIVIAQKAECLSQFKQYINFYVTKTLISKVERNQKRQLDLANIYKGTKKEEVDDIESYDSIKYDKELSLYIKKKLNILTDLQAKCLTLYLGLNGEEPISMAKIAEKLNKTHGSVKAVIAESLRKLRCPANLQRLKDYYEQYK